MSCPEREELVRDVDGELSVNRHRELEHHLQQCAACARTRQDLLRMVDRIQPDEGEFEDPELVEGIMRALPPPGATDPAPEPRAWWRALRVGVPALAAAAALLVAGSWWLADRRPAEPGEPAARGRPEFVPRGGAADDPERWVALEIFSKPAPREPYRAAGQSIGADGALAFAYRNVGGRYRYLMIFAVAGDGRIYWYYPAYERAGDDPSSVPIEEGRHKLPDEVEHDLRGGALRIVGLFSREPLRVSAVERAVSAALARGGGLSHLGRLPFAGSGQASRIVQVIAPRKDHR